MDAVTGITGQVGGRVATTLLGAGRQVRAVVRDATKEAAWAARGCDVAVADVNDAKALAAAFRGVDGVFVLLPPTFDPSPGFDEAKRAIAALRDALDVARPSKVVCLSTIGARASQPNLLNQLGLLETALETLPMPMAFLRAAWFIENSAWDIGPARETGEFASYLQPLDREIPMVATADVGRVAAELLQEEWVGHRVVELEGLRRVAPLDIAAVLTRLLGRPVHARAVPRDEWEVAFRAQGMRNPLPRMQMLDGFNEGWIEFDEGARSSRKGRVTLAEVLRGLT